jgi:hypothetical protein
VLLLLHLSKHLHHYTNKTHNCIQNNTSVICSKCWRQGGKMIATPPGSFDQSLTDSGFNQFVRNNILRSSEWSMLAATCILWRQIAAFEKWLLGRRVKSRFPDYSSPWVKYSQKRSTRCWSKRIESHSKRLPLVDRFWAFDRSW